MSTTTASDLAAVYPLIRNMVSGGKHHLRRPQHHHHMGFHLPHFGAKKEATARALPKGCMAINVGSEGEELQRFVMPVEYLNHPLFAELLKEAEKEFGFDQKGTITIPCHVDEFRQIRSIIDGDTTAHPHPHPHPHHHRHLAGCFRS